MSRFIERWYPYALGLVLPAMYGLFLRAGRIIPAQNMTNLLVGASTIAGILVGFLATAKSILFAIPDRSIVERLKESGAYEQLVVYLLHSVYHWLVVAALGLVLLVAPGVVSSQHERMIFFAWLYCVGVALCSFVRAVNLISRLLRGAAK